MNIKDSYINGKVPDGLEIIDAHASGLLRLFAPLTLITVTNNACRCRLFWPFSFFTAPVNSFHPFYAIALGNINFLY